MRVGTLLDNVFSPSPGRSYLRIQRKALLRNDTIDIMLRMIYVTHIGHYATDRPAVSEMANRRSMHNAEIGMPEKISAAAQSIDHAGSIDVCRVDMPIDVHLNRGIHGNREQSGYQFSVVG